VSSLKSQPQSSNPSLKAQISVSRPQLQPPGPNPSLEAQIKIVAKALDGQRYPLPLCEYMWVCDGERGSGPEGADDLCFHTGENSPPSPSSPSSSSPSTPSTSLKAQNLASRLNCQPQGSYSSFEPQIPASRLEFQPRRSNSSLKAQN